MAKESQLTFDDIGSNRADEIYALVANVASSITESERNRSGDNCATISKRETKTEDKTEFCIQLPPKTKSFSIDKIDSVNSELSFYETSVQSINETTCVIWKFRGSINESDELTIVIIKPVESPLKTEPDDEDSDGEQTTYSQFDFTKFVRNSD